MRRLHFRHLLWPPFSHNLSAGCAAFRPRSMTQSADLIMSRLCSATTTVLPLFTSLCSMANSFLMSSICSPVVWHGVRLS